MVLPSYACLNTIVSFCLVLIVMEMESCILHLASSNVIVRFIHGTAYCYSSLIFTA